MKHLINISDLRKKDFEEILLNVNKLKKKTSNILKNKKVGLIFENYSTRTRLSFMAAISDLNGNYLDINMENLNLQRYESLEDTFKIFGCYLDAIVYRTKNHNNLEIAKNNFKKPVINALSEYSHPCQAISDIYSIKDHFKTLKNISITWLGDINNVLLSLTQCMQFLPQSNLNIISHKKILELKKNYLHKSKNIKVFTDLDRKVLSSSNCIMTDVYTSMNDKKDLSKEKLLKQFQVNKNLMNQANKQCIFMHCLPANVGSEVTEDVLNGKQSIILKQAKNKIYAQKAILKWLKI